MINFNERGRTKFLAVFYRRLSKPGDNSQGSGSRNLEEKNPENWRSRQKRFPGRKQTHLPLRSPF